ncbi:TetR/AcrR family transcriptional regulator [Pseudomonas sp. LP_7_YM]|uniref:TetR/AcrR family transcriptional regulator n=1 Tax=Pseudomonas sp. LP_7_YM TaxID=2485137 RepID=UPI00105D45B8|nr:TetR/AcrR family transcriptional regulator [Pseudomonas sp. LP_7_YM]TDV63410.1 TetR family transcriptional regulator [Pseudomonas sp. LP_7_YM]
MAKPSHREKILTEGLKVVHERGFAGASVRDIVQAAGVPQGSFTNHFMSKEAFGLEIIDLYFDAARQVVDQTLLNPGLSPVARVVAYIDTHRCTREQDVHKGCLFGNFTAESTEHSEPIRLRLVQIYEWLTSTIASCLDDAISHGDLSQNLDSRQVALFILSSLQGALLLAKAQRTLATLESFSAVLTNDVLRLPRLS